jgi:hypothetical protein
LPARNRSAFCSVRCLRSIATTAGEIGARAPGQGFGSENTGLRQACRRSGGPSTIPRRALPPLTVTICEVWNPDQLAVQMYGLSSNAAAWRALLDPINSLEASVIALQGG